MLLIRWRDHEAAGCIDEIPDSWLSREGYRSIRTHYVIAPDGTRDRARCSVTVAGPVVHFDYRPDAFRKFNRDEGMAIGVMRLRFRTPGRTGLPKVFWKGPADARFESALADAERTEWDRAIVFEAELAASRKLSPEQRARRLSKAKKIPTRVAVTSHVFRRNADVVAEVLHQAAGICGACGKKAPFVRADNREPYLEVHHRVRLADGGEDTVGNAVALCPNCHRRAHFG